jgi:hypothetical protein
MRFAGQLSFERKDASWFPAAEKDISSSGRRKSKPGPGSHPQKTQQMNPEGPAAHLRK